MRRGFSLIEVGMVMGLLALALTFTMTTAVQGYDSYNAWMRRANTKNECQRAVERIFRLSRQGYRLDADNHGLRCGSHRVRWENNQLKLDHEVLLPGLLRDFSAVRRGPVLTLNLTLEVPYRRRGAPLLLHEIYDFPRMDPP